MFNRTSLLVLALAASFNAVASPASDPECIRELKGVNTMFQLRDVGTNMDRALEGVRIAKIKPPMGEEYRSLMVFAVEYAYKNPDSKLEDGLVATYNECRLRRG